MAAPKPHGPLKRFNIRVYGLLIHNARVLLIDEEVRGRHITKFPGGGLELGEGPAECIVREFREETGINVRAAGHVYTTDFFQASAFRPDEQIISIYFRVEAIGEIPDSDLSIPYDQHQPHENILGLRWLALSKIRPEDVTLPIDRHVVTHFLPGLGGPG